MTEFDRGVFDCVMGVPHKKGQSFEYDRGYIAQFTKEKKLAKKETEVGK